MMMQSRIILTFIATIGTNSSLAQAKSCKRNDKVEGLPKRDSALCGSGTMAWCGNDFECCPNVEDVDCAAFVSHEHYVRQTDCSISSDSIDNYDTCAVRFQLNGLMVTRSQPGGGLLFDSNNCPRCNMLSGQTAWSQEGLPGHVTLTVPKENCIVVPNSPEGAGICPGS